MSKVVSIYEAKTNLSKLVKRAEAGETIYIGAYGKQQAILAPAPAKQKINIGVWAHKADPNYNSDELIGPDAELNKRFEDSLNGEL